MSAGFVLDSRSRFASGMTGVFQTEIRSHRNCAGARRGAPQRRDIVGIGDGAAAEGGRAGDEHVGAGLDDLPAPSAA